jgi:hypothetical protein
MIDRLYFFQIPIYRCTSEKFRNETLELIKKRKEYFENQLHWQRTSSERLLILKKSVFQDIEKRAFSKHWKYNEVIGWIELYIWSGQIRGDLWEVNRKRIKRFGKKEYFYLSKIFEMHIFTNESSNKIFLRLLESLRKLNDEIFQKRYMDLSILENTGKFINWKKLVQFGK